jgi:hypothetical protein
MAGYTRTDTTNNIADGNIINAADLDNEFDGIQAAFNSSTGHNHDGTTGEGAPILVLGPTQDVVIGATAVTPKTTNTVDIGSSSLKFKDLHMAGNALIGGTLGVTGATTLSAALTYGGVTLSNAVTGTGNMVLSASPTLTGTLAAAAATFSGNVTLGDATTDTVTVNGYMGVGGAGTAGAGIYVGSTALSGTSQVGVISTPVGTSGSTSVIASFRSTPASAAASFTSANVIGLWAQDVTKGAGSTITNQHGVYIVDQTQGTNNFGITSLVSSGSNKWNLYASGTAQNYLAGNLLIGTTSIRGVGATTMGGILIEGAAADQTSRFVAVRNTNDAFGATLALGKSRGTSVGSATIVQNGDACGQIYFAGADGVDLTIRCAQISGEVDGVPGSNVMPGRLVFSTNSGTESLSERMRITSAGNVGIGTSSPSNLLSVSAATGATIQVVSTNAVNPGILRAQNSDGVTFDFRMNGSSAAANASAAQISTSGTQPILFIQSGVEAMRITGGVSYGNLGLGVTPSAWGSSNKAVQLPGGAVWAFSTTQFSVGQNVLDTGSGTFVYVNSAEATRYRQLAGSHAWFTAPSGTAGAAITFTQAVTLSSSGNLGIGTTSPVSRLDVADATSAIITLTRTDSTSGNGVIRSVGNTNVTNAAIALGGGVNNHITFTTVTSERLRIDSSGNVQTLTGAQVVWAPAPASISTTATLTNANIQGQIINTTGTSYTVTMPLGTTLETLVSWATTDLGYNFTVINTASGTITMAVNTGVTSLGGLTIATGISAQFRIRRTAANTFILYRLS